MNPRISDLARQGKRDSERVEASDLDSRYGSIGIPAVAAAARYPSDSRKDAFPRARREADDEA